MSKSKQQGTANETATVGDAHRWGLNSRRIAEGGSKDIGDVIISGDNIDRPVVGVQWKRLVKTGKQKRQPDGEPNVVVVTIDDFMWLMQTSGLSAILECKATERLNVTRVLDKARKKAGVK